MAVMRSRIASIENLIAQDPGRRNIFPLVQRGHLRLAALSLLRAERVLLVSGFPILQAGVGETDGPPGAWAIGNALRRMGIEVAYLTDERNVPVFRAIGAEPLVSWAPDLLDRERFSHLVAVELPGRGRDNRYYNMRGEDITHLLEPLNELFLQAEVRGITTIGIGDGGNEVGMGKVFQGVSRVVRHGRRIASTVLTDCVIVSGVSNWGAYGLVGALSVVSGRDLLPSPEELARSVTRLVEAGAVDGITGRREPCVDGLPISQSQALLQEIRWQLLPSPLDRLPDLSVGVVGAGESGLAVARLLLRRGARVRISDRRAVDIPEDLKGCAWERGGHSVEFLQGVDLLVRSPGIASHEPVIVDLREWGVPVLSELEVAYQLGRPSLVAVTGSVGKLSTIRALASLMACCGRPLPVGGNKGRPLSQLVEENPDAWIGLAISSFQLESIVRFRPRVGVILNIGNLHLDRHGDVTETVRIKSRIFMNQGPGDVLILNQDDPYLARLGEKHWGETLFVSSRSRPERGAWFEEGKIYMGLDAETHELGPAPKAYMEDLLSAILATHMLGVPPERIREALRAFA
jgi:hypothetical protein